MTTTSFTTRSTYWMRGLAYPSGLTRRHISIPRQSTAQSLGGSFQTSPAALMEEYRDARPREARYYFVHEDGQPLDYTEFVDLLQTCLLHTSYRMLHVGPHGLRIGGASLARLAGVNILQVRYLGRWTSTSNTIDHYTRTAFVSMPPERIYEEVKRYRKIWQYPRLAFLARNVVQTWSPELGVHMRQC